MNQEKLSNNETEPRVATTAFTGAEYTKDGKVRINYASFSDNKEDAFNGVVAGYELSENDIPNSVEIPAGMTENEQNAFLDLTRMARCFESQMLKGDLTDEELQKAAGEYSKYSQAASMLKEFTSLSKDEREALSSAEFPDDDPNDLWQQLYSWGEVRRNKLIEADLVTDDYGNDLPIFEQEMGAFELMKDAYLSEEYYKTDDPGHYHNTWGRRIDGFEAMQGLSPLEVTHEADWSVLENATQNQLEQAEEKPEPRAETLAESKQEFVWDQEKFPSALDQDIALTIGGHLKESYQRLNQATTPGEKREAEYKKNIYTQANRLINTYLIDWRGDKIEQKRVQELGLGSSMLDIMEYRLKNTENEMDFVREEIAKGGEFLDDNKKDLGKLQERHTALELIIYTYKRKNKEHSTLSVDEDFQKRVREVLGN